MYKVEVMQKTFLEHNGIKLQINNRKKAGHVSNILELKNI
jgi:hypothetical protein